MLKIPSLLLIMVCLICSTCRSYAQQPNTRIDSLVMLANRAVNPDSGIAIAKHIYQISKTTGNKRGMLRSFTITALKSYDAGRYTATLNAVKEAEPLAMELNDYGLASMILTLKGNSYTQLGFFKDARHSLYLSESYAKKIRDNDQRHYRLGYMYFALAKNIEETGKNTSSHDSVVFYTRKNYNEQKQVSVGSKYGGGLTIAAGNMGALYTELKQYDSAKYYFNEALVSSRNGEFVAASDLALKNLGFLYYTIKNYKQALFYYKSALDIASKLNNGYEKKDIYQGLSQVYRSLNDAERSRFFLKKYARISDSLSVSTKRSISAPLAYIVNENEKIYINKIGYYIRMLIISLCLLLLSLAAVLALFKKFIKEKIKGKEQTRLLGNKNKLLENQLAVKQIDTEDINIIVQLAIANDPAFFVKFKELNTEFIRKLLHQAPNLVAAELELCALLRLNFETKEIARYTHMSVRSVEGRKYRVRKKLMLPPKEDINIWMVNL